MDSKQIAEAFKLNSMLYRIFQGVFLNNNIPIDYLKSKRNCFFVVNTISSTHNIGHWVLFYIKDYCLYFFDSLGKDPEYYDGDIKKFYNQFMFDKLVVFRKQIQNSTSSVCGAYVIYFAYILFTCENVYRLKAKFTLQYVKNDKIVVNFVDKLFGIEQSCNINYCPVYMYMENKCREDCKCCE